MELFRIKPLKRVHQAFALLFVVPIVIIFEIFSLFSFNLKDFLIGQIIVISFVGLISLIFFAVRIFYPSYFVFTKEEVIKYHHRRIVFKIRKADILEIKFKEMSFVSWLFLIPEYISGQPLCEVLSFRFRVAEICSPNTYGECGTEISFLTEKEKEDGLREYCEFFTKREILRIVDYLAVPFSPLN